MDSSAIIMAAIFVVIAVVSSAIYYFARYYVKTDHTDKELLTKKPVDWQEKLTIERTEEKDGVLVAGDSEKLAAEAEAKSAAKVAAQAAREARLADPDLDDRQVLDAPSRKSLEQALTRTRESLWGRIKKLAGLSGDIQPEIRDELEEILYTSDLGPATAELLLSKVTESLSSADRRNLDTVRGALRLEMLEMFASAKPSSPQTVFERVHDQEKPRVWMVVGVNGAGKTTTIGKLASLARNQNLRTLIVAGDTFRAAADSQLKAWADRSGCEVFSPDNTKDPSAVAYSGLEKALAMQADLVIIDTAGRLHTQDHLMEELRKMKRVLAKLRPEAPHECLLVIDANAGQNALQQAREFHAAVGLTGVVITKMDGSSKAGVALGVAHELKIPIVYIGVGESVEDLRPFEAKAFVEAIL